MDTYGTGKECPLLGGVRYSEVFIELVPKLCPLGGVRYSEVFIELVPKLCPLRGVSAIQHVRYIKRFHCTIFCKDKMLRLEFVL